MNVRFKRTLATGVAALILGIGVAVSSTPTFAKELPGGVREPSSAGNLQGGQGGGCKGPACNEKGSTPTGVKNVSPPKPSRPQLPLSSTRAVWMARSVRPVDQSAAATRAPSASRTVRGVETISTLLPSD